ncbi:MAG: GAF domain-containing protein, partial [Chloroflexi bacterium]|nr:GAF domain-containing protein [Chloroflexota bacterium]
MTIYAVFPLIATLAYIPLLIITLTARPWQRRQTFFVIFLFAAMSWSFADILLRGNFLPQYDLALFKIIVVTFAVMAVQFYLFVTTFYPPGRARWLVAAYVSLGAIVLATLMDRVTRDIVTIGDRVYHQYDLGVILVAVSIAVLGARSLYVLINTLSKLESPALYNQVVSLLVGISTMIAFALTIFLPWGREFSLSHFGNLVAAFVLTYAIIRHKLVDFRIVMRRGSAAVFLAIVGAVTYWLILQALGRLFGLQIDPAGTFVATGAAILVAVGLYYARGTLVAGINRIFQGESYDYRQNLSDFAGRIHNIFSLKDQGGELLALVAKAVDCKRACLLFPEGGGEDFASQFVEPKDNNPFSNLTLRGHSPIVEYLGWERKPLASDNLGILPGFLSLWEREKEEIRSKEVELFVPLISRGRLVAILVLGKKHSGRYSLEDLTLLESITNRVAVSIEKEYLREQLREREEELSVINRSSSIITSSLNIQATYDSFIKELKKVVDVSWAAITLIEEHNLYFLALSTEIGSAWKVGERIPIKGTATEWIATSRKPLFEPDLSRESRFSLGKYHLMQGVR